MELLLSNSFALGIDLPIRDSGSREPSPTVTIVGPNGMVDVSTGVLAAWRRMHLGEEDANQMNLKDGEKVSICTKGDRSVMMNNVKVRVGNFAPEIHIDVDEANATNIKNGIMVEIVKQ